MTEFEEISFPWEKIGSFKRSDPFAIVWAYFSDGSAKKFTGSNELIGEAIKNDGRPCFLVTCYGREKLFSIDNILPVFQDETPERKEMIVKHLNLLKNRHPGRSRIYWSFENLGCFKAYVSHVIHPRNLYYGDHDPLADKDATKKKNFKISLFEYEYDTRAPYWQRDAWGCVKENWTFFLRKLPRAFPSQVNEILARAHCSSCKTDRAMCYECKWNFPTAKQDSMSCEGGGNREKE